MACLFPLVRAETHGFVVEHDVLDDLRGVVGDEASWCVAGTVKDAVAKLMLQYFVRFYGCDDVNLTSPFCCSEYEDSSDLNSRIYSSSSLCFLTCSFMSLSCPMYCTLSLTVCKCTPCQQSKPHQYNMFFFSRGHDPYAHACKARPSSTDVGLL